MEAKTSSSSSSSSIRWAILRDAFLAQSRSSSSSSQPEKKKRISRTTTRAGGGGFNMIPCHRVTNINSNSNTNDDEDGGDDVYVSYILPLNEAPTLVLRQRPENTVNLNDFRICNKYDIDNTGLVCHWPSEDVLAYFCLSNADMFRSKRILELGAGYGLAGLVIAASTDALEVVISDGNPQVVDYIQHNIQANSAAYAETRVKSMILHWNQEDISNISNTFDIIIASDCTFFKEFHEGLAQTVKCLLKHSEASEAIFLSPKRGNSMEKFLEQIKGVGLRFSITENYDKKVWQLHQNFTRGDGSWPNYEVDHCYPLLVRIKP
ncbi:hypothetical protein AQUCO_00700041v1 [Aquilegia coerulea]|uniref:Calmodulin-lysine N-methyltransferase n=1 Tax=Aquilegia coerulea TaxID=218851 RepID=A0A2G5EI82_AQUCA|nr:hypothetical protein AQUCO_00700041v1 [Aquilegia coerulea]